MQKEPVPPSVKILSFFLVLSMAAAGYTAWLSYRMRTEFKPSIASMSPLEKSLHQVGQSAPLSEDYRYGRPNAFGDYLIGRFAQAHHDWTQASEVMQTLLKDNPNNVPLLKRGMVLAMGSGESARALKIAHQIYAQEKDNALVLLFMIAEAFHNKDYKAAQAYILSLPHGSASDFILPLLQSWTDAAEGKLNIAALKGNSIHMYHAILIADFLKKGKKIDDLLAKAQKAKDLNLYDLERIADLYAHLGRKDMALNFYTQIQSLNPQPLIQEKIENLKSPNYKNAMQSVHSPQEGIASAFYDMARALIDEYSDESARVFGNLALYLDPNLTNAKLLLAHITARNGRFSEAISYYHSIAPSDAGYVHARRSAAELLEQEGHVKAAIAELKALAESHKDVEAVIQMGNIYRRTEQFKKAIQSYDQAQALLGGTVPSEYWHLLYVRGMAEERLGNWDKAEKDLQAALAFQPEHPYVLNYLGYAWADQGVHLDKALKMIRQAVSLRPADGYITDSLGWVLYKQGQYDEAIEHLERAVELMPYDPVVNDHLGDAYWKAGRKLEARFQWERALNYSDTADGTNEETQKMKKSIRHKLEDGLSRVFPSPLYTPLFSPFSSPLGTPRQKG